MTGSRFAEARVLHRLSVCKLVVRLAVPSQLSLALSDAIPYRVVQMLSSLIHLNRMMISAAVGKLVTRTIWLAVTRLFNRVPLRQKLTAGSSRGMFHHSRCIHHYDPAVEHLRIPHLLLKLLLCLNPFLHLLVLLR